LPAKAGAAALTQNAKLQSKPAAIAENNALDIVRSILFEWTPARPDTLSYFIEPQELHFPRPAVAIRKANGLGGDPTPPKIFVRCRTKSVINS